MHQTLTQMLMPTELASPKNFKKLVPKATLLKGKKKEGSLTNR